MMKNGRLTSIAGRKAAKWYCLGRMLKKSKDRWQICFKHTSNQNTIVNLNNLTNQWSIIIRIWLSGNKLVSSSLIRTGIFPYGLMRGLIFIRFDFYKLTFIIIIIILYYNT